MLCYKSEWVIVSLPEVKKRDEGSVAQPDTNTMGRTVRLVVTLIF